MTLAIRLKAYAPNGGLLGTLPNPLSVSASFSQIERGVLEFSYSRDGIGYQHLTSDVEVAVELSHNGGDFYEPINGRFLVLEEERERTTDRVERFIGHGYVFRLSKAVIDRGGTVKDGRREFSNVTPGSLLTTIINAAKGRGALAGITTSSFSATTDSAGKPWTNSLTISYELGMDLLTVVTNLLDQGAITVEFNGREMKVYNGDRSVDRTTVANGEITLFSGRDVIEAPERVSKTHMADVAYVKGDQDGEGKETFISISNPTNRNGWGRWETTINQGGVNNLGTLEWLGSSLLERTGKARREATRGIAFDSGPRPMKDYFPGDWIYEDSFGIVESLRVFMVTIYTDDNGALIGSIILNDRIAELEQNLVRRVNGIIGGSTVGGGSGATPINPPVVNDKTIPKAPTGLAATSEVYLNPEGFPRAILSLGWTAITQNTDNTPITDFQTYEVNYRKIGDAEWTSFTTSNPSAVVGGMQVMTPYEWRVRAIDTSAHKSGWSAVSSVTTKGDTTPPVKPSKPKLATAFGVVTVTWEGQSATGGQMDLDFSYVTIHRSKVQGFTPSSSTASGRLTGSGSLPYTGQAYGESWYYRLVATDTSGNNSTPSDEVSISTAPLVSGDLAQKVIEAGHIKANQIQADHLQAGFFEGIVIQGSTIRTAASGNRIVIDSTGIRSIQGGVNAVNIRSNGQAEFSGIFRTSSGGARIELLPSPSTGQSAVALYSGVAGETTPGYLFSSIAGTGSAANAALTLMPPTKSAGKASRLTLFTTDSDSGADIDFRGHNGSVYWGHDKGYGAHYFKNLTANKDWLQVAPYNSDGLSALVNAPVDLLLQGGRNCQIYGGSTLLFAANDLTVQAGGTVTLHTPKLMQVQGVTVKIIGNLDHSGGSLLLTDIYGQMRLKGSQDSTSSFVQSEVIFDRTYTGAANMYITSSYVIGRSTSLESAKVNIDRKWADSADLAAIKALNPASFYDRGNAERYAELVGDREGCDDADDAEFPRRILGLIAEDVQSLGLSDLVTYDESGELAGVAYDRVAVALLPWLRELDRRLADLEGKN